MDTQNKTQREIKFRAWDKVKKEMMLDPYIDNSDCIDGCCVGSVYLSEFFSDEDFIFMQYTGLKDKHGEEVYEGDIVEQEGKRAEVVFWECEFLALWEDDTDSAENLTMGEFEVIGNKFENPEMLY